MPIKVMRFKDVIQAKEEDRVFKSLFAALAVSAIALLRLTESRTPVLPYGHALYHLGEDYLRKHKMEQALRFFHRALEYNPNLPQIHNELAFVYYQKKNYSEAIQQAEQAIFWDRAYHQAYYNLGLIYRDQRDFRRALGYLEKALFLYPHYPFAPVYTYAIGTSAIDVGDYEKASGQVKDLQNMGALGLAKDLEDRLMKKNRSFPRD